MWVSVALVTDAARAEALSEALAAAGAISVSVEDAQAGTELETPQFAEPDATGAIPAAALWAESRVVALFQPLPDLIGRIASAAVDAGIVDLPEIELEEVAEQDWVRLTQAQFEPIRINDRLWIVPSWHVAPDPEATTLMLDPGLAFGTGSHPTTFLCLDWLSDALRGGAKPGPSVLDYGCGSSILGIAAAKLGASRVLGIDIDENALGAAGANAAANDAAIELRHSKDTLDEQFDIVVANILTNPLCVLAPLLAGRVGKHGRIALAGVLAAQAGQVIDAYSPWISLRIGAEREGWVRLEGNRC